MAKKKRVNPHRRPASLATVRKIAEDVKGEAVSLAIALFLTVMCDKFGFDAEQLQKVCCRPFQFLLGGFSNPDRKMMGSREEPNWLHAVKREVQGDAHM